MAGIFDLFRRIEKERAPASPPTHLLVGLGNPGEPYRFTRHNVGFMALDLFAEHCGTALTRVKFKGLTAPAAPDGVSALLLKPQTFMNLSGQAVREAAAFYRIPPERILVFCDDVNFEVGAMRIRLQGSAGGHKGLASIMEHLGSDAFPRIRIGVGKKPHPDYELTDWVLGKFSPADQDALAPVLERAYEAARLLLAGKTDEALRRYST